MEGFGFVGSSGDRATQEELDSGLVKSWSEKKLDWVICIGSISGSYSHLARSTSSEDILDFLLEALSLFFGAAFLVGLVLKRHRVESGKSDT